MALINDLLKWALQIKNQTKPAGNTETEVGGLFEAMVRYLMDMGVGIVLKGEKANEAAIKTTVTPVRGDCYKAKDTGYYWVYDGTGWNNVGAIIPSDAATVGNLKLKADINKADGSTVVYTDKQSGKIATGYLPVNIVQTNADGKIPVSILPLATASSSGLITKEDKILLNEIQDGMKSDEDKYTDSIFLSLSNQEKNVNYSQAMRVDTNAARIDYKMVSGAYTKQSYALNASYLSVLSVETNMPIQMHFNNLSAISLYPELKADSIMIASREGSKLEQINLTNLSAKSIDLSAAISAKKIFMAYSLVTAVNLLPNRVLNTFSCYNSANITDIRLHGGVLETIAVENCKVLEKIAIGEKANNLKTVNISNTKFTKEALLELVNNWTSRVGKETGSLKISRSLYDMLDQTNRNSIINKNITLQYE